MSDRWPFLMAPNDDRIAWDAEYDQWFSGHPFAAPFIFSPIRWLRHLFEEVSE